MKRVARPLSMLRVVPLCFAAASACADPNDTLQLSASYNITHDDNLFRLPKNANAAALIGRDSPADTIKSTTASAFITKDYGLQHIDFRASAVNYDYTNFSYLGFTAFNYTGRARWSLTPRIRGSISSDRQQSLNSFGDFRNYTQRNERIALNTRAEAVYELDGAYQLAGAASQLKVTTSSPVIEQRGFDLRSVDVGLRRVFSSRTEAGYRFRVGNGEFSPASIPGVSSLPSKFDETEHELRLYWAVTGKTNVDTRVSYLKRNYDDFNSRNYSGVVASTNVDWSVTGQINMRAGIARELTDFQSNYSSYATGDRLTLTPSWQIQDKVTLRLRHDQVRRQFRGPIIGLPPASMREDKLYLTRLTVEWVPRDQISLSAWVQQDKRDSNFSDLSYTSRVVGMLAQLTF